MTASVRQVIGASAAKVRHLQVNGLTTGCTWCGRYIRNPAEMLASCNCRKCLDDADLEEGKRNHVLSITDLRDRGDRWIGSVGSCSCGNWQEEEISGRIKAGGTGPMIVSHYNAHVIGAVRAARPKPEEGADA